MNAFEPFPKLARLSRDMVITEKLDGTNAQVLVVPVREAQDHAPFFVSELEGEPMALFAGSRTRTIHPGKDTDNFGFAAWVQDNRHELVKLGPGRHFGEWYGQGIQRGYGLNTRRFALFNVGRWNDENKPECCHVVPVLHRYTFSTETIDTVLTWLKRDGSSAVPGYMNPEGVVVFHSAAGVLFKKTFEKDDTGKEAA